MKHYAASETDDFIISVLHLLDEKLETERG